MYRILFVCTGNICRSPTAEGIMDFLIAREGLQDRISVDSAGTSAWYEGDAPDFRAAAYAKFFGVDISGLKARSLSNRDFTEFDLILGMDDNNMDILQRTAAQVGSTAKIDRLSAYAPSYGKDIPDPYYNDSFDYVFEVISIACENLLAELKSCL